MSCDEKLLEAVRFTRSIAREQGVPVTLADFIVLKRDYLSRYLDPINNGHINAESAAYYSLIDFCILFGLYKHAEQIFYSRI